MGIPKGPFNHRARISLAWEWEETRFRGWCALTRYHHASRLTAD